MTILYLVHDLRDAAVRRRVRFLREGGAAVTLMGFERRAGQDAGARPDGRVLGSTRNGKFGQRIAAMIRAVLFSRRWQGAMRDSDVIVARINDLFGEKLDTIFDLPRIYDELAVEIKARLVGDFGKYGMELADFYLNSITPPPEVEKMIDERSGLEAVGNLDSFFKFKAAKAMVARVDQPQWFDLRDAINALEAT